MVFDVDSPEVRTAMLLRTFFETVEFTGAINPFEVANADAVYANLCRLADPHLVPTELDAPVRVLRYVDLSTGFGGACLECWSLLSTGGVDKILFDPLGPEEKEFEAAFGAAYRQRYLSALQAHLNIADPLTGEPVALSMIGIDKDRVPVLRAESPAGVEPDAVITYDRIGLNLGTNVGRASGNRAASMTTTKLEVLAPTKTSYEKTVVTYGKGMGVNDCAARPGMRTPKQLDEQFIFLNGAMK